MRRMVRGKDLRIRIRKSDGDMSVEFEWRVVAAIQLNIATINNRGTRVLCITFFAPYRKTLADKWAAQQISAPILDRAGIVRTQGGAHVTLHQAPSALQRRLLCRDAISGDPV